MDVEWDYSSERGPEKWHTLCDWFAEGAKFPFQSPINLSKAQSEQLAKTQKIDFHYKKETFTEKEFKNTFHFVPPNTESYVVFENQEYHLTDIHFHMPSEHTLEAKQFPLEFHLVHMNEIGENLVVGCLFTLINGKNRFSEGRKALDWAEDSHRQFFDPSIFIPETKEYFHYVGSLTTPPTKGPVQWFVFDTIQPMEQAFIEKLKEGMLIFNNRPLQPLNERSVYFTE